MEAIKALVLNSIDYKEASKILYLYTEKGHLSVIAHGVKKMNSINRFLSQNGTYIKLTTTQSKFPSLKEGEMINDYENIKKDILTYTYQNHIMESVKYTISDDLNHVKMFQFMLKVFNQMNENVDPELLSFIFELKLLYFIGYGLNFKSCSVCDKKEHLVFSPSHGGLICKEHLQFKDVSYNKDIHDILKYLYYIDIDKTTPFDLTPSERMSVRVILDILFSDFMNFKSKSREILKQIKKY